MQLLKSNYYNYRHVKGLTKRCFGPQLTKGQRYRFSLIINELKNAEIVPYMTTCLAFVNTILIATEDFEERVRLRNEFAGEK